MLVALLLLINNVMGYFCKRDALSKKNNNYIICCTALYTTTYSTSVIDITTVFFPLVNQNTVSRLVLLEEL